MSLRSKYLERVWTFLFGLQRRSFHHSCLFLWFTEPSSPVHYVHVNFASNSPAIKLKIALFEAKILLFRLQNKNPNMLLGYEV